MGKISLQQPVNVQAQTSSDLSEPSLCSSTDKSSTVVKKKKKAMFAVITLIDHSNRSQSLNIYEGRSLASRED